MELIRKYFDKYMKQSEKDWKTVSSLFRKQEFPKGYILLHTGQTENYLSFLNKGIVRFFISKEDNDLTFDFAFENNFFSGYSSFLTRNPSVYQIEALTQIEVWQLSYHDLQKVYNETDIGNFIGRQAGEELFLKKSKRELSFLNETAEERYLNLFTEQPDLLQKIPLKYIASYIGITPQALSRIRKRNLFTK